MTYCCAKWDTYKALTCSVSVLAVTGATLTVYRFMLDLAIQTEGVIVTNDNYRDLYEEKYQYRFVIEHR